MGMNNRGIALFLVLWVLALLTVIVGEFCHAMRTEVNITRNFKEETEARYFALAGINRAVLELVRNDRIAPKSADAEAEEGVETAPRWRVNAELPPVPYGTGQFTVALGNEIGKINLNLADASLLKILLNGFDLPEEDIAVIVDSIQDWRDEDNAHRLNGAEDDYYRSLPEPYECRDGDFESVEELLLVRGVTREIFFGGLRDRVTVFRDDDKKSQLKKIRKKQAAQSINVNAAPPEVLLALPQMTEELVSKIMEYRKAKDFSTSSELAEILGPEVYAAVAPYLTFAWSSFYTIRSTGQAGDGKAQSAVEATVQLDRRSKTGYRILSWKEE
jgi:general secretion pathway protein K